MPIRNLGQKLLLSLLLAAGVFAAFMLYTDLQSLGAALVAFRWEWMGPVLAMTALNLGLRFIKWNYYLRLLEVRGVAPGDNVAIFLSNFALVLTPGKVGGFLKAYFLGKTSGVPFARAMPVVLAERLTDGLGLVLMTALALTVFPSAWPVVALVVAGMATVIVVSQVRPLALWLLALAARLPVVGRFAGSLTQIYEGARELLGPRPLAVAAVLGTIARASEGAALGFVLLGLGLEPSRALWEQSIFVAALSNIVGVVAMMPGGLGGTEASMAGLLDGFVGLAPAPATAATLLARFGSLWVPALLGLASLLWKRHAFFAAEPEPEAVAVTGLREVAG